jgi:glycerol-3-phosphate acyltransferase PlsY
VLDLLKGYFPIIITFTYFENLISYSALICFIGHILPVWLKFKGGKGVATYLGVILALSYKFFLIFGVTWLVLSFLFRYASLSSIISSLIVFVYSYFFINNFSLILFIFFVIIIYTHRENIVRLKKSEESKIKL